MPVVTVKAAFYCIVFIPVFEESRLVSCAQAVYGKVLRENLTRMDFAAIFAEPQLNIRE